MYISKVSLRQFRNLQEVHLCFQKGLNVVLGDNGQGKTNLLESLFYLSLARSFRIKDDRSLIMHDKDYGDIRALVHKDERSYTLRCYLHRQGKALFYQDSPIRKSSDFIGLLNVILFAPDDLTLFSDAPSVRRLLLNQEIVKLDNYYFLCLARYNHLLKQRNALLKQRDVDEMVLSTLSQQMVPLEAYIMAKRKLFFQVIDSVLEKYYRILAKSEDRVSIAYLDCLHGKSIEEEALETLHLKSLAKDKELKMTSSGIHREDFRFDLNGESVVEVASQGQKRMLMLAFKLALYEYVKKIGKMDPVLLLDDVLSELDEERQRNLLKIFSRVPQCILTTTHLPSFVDTKDMHIFTVRQGKIIEGGSL